MVNFSVFATCETMAPLVMAFFIAFGAMASAGVGSCDGAVARWCLLFAGFLPTVLIFLKKIPMLGK